MAMMQVSPWSGVAARVLLSVVEGPLSAVVSPRASPLCDSVVLPHVDGRRQSEGSGIRWFCLHFSARADQPLPSCIDTGVWHFLHHCWLSSLCGRKNC